ncbi:YcaO-like family protein [Nonomuraea sp. NPDC050783]|uniref:YcaO-like family protein n=1 Tax=Nonomuraea sp. NPDC050783 TaxID=3154634 RepID=UPI003466A57D
MASAERGPADKQQLDGTHRARTPERTWEWIAPHLREYGITRVADITGLDVIGIPVYQAIRPAATTLSVSQGKGADHTLAKVSAVMEAIELWHAEHLTAVDDVRTARSLGGLSYRWDDIGCGAASFVHDDLPMYWLQGRGLLTGDIAPVPLDIVRLDATYAPRWVPHLFEPSSNGLASGNTVTEATVHALCEVIERDTMARLGDVPGRDLVRLDLATVDDQGCGELLERLREAGVGLDVVAGTGRTGIPYFEVRGTADTPPHAFAGYGCHPDHRVALSRALTEAAQSRLTGIAGSRDDDERPYPAAPRGNRPAPMSCARTMPWQALEDHSAATLDADLDFLADRVRRATGHEPIRVLLPSPTDIPVVKVVAPGLRVPLGTSRR